MEGRRLKDLVAGSCKQCYNHVELFCICNLFSANAGHHVILFHSQNVYQVVLVTYKPQPWLNKQTVLGLRLSPCSHFTLCLMCHFQHYVSFDTKAKKKKKKRVDGAKFQPVFLVKLVFILPWDLSVNSLVPGQNWRESGKTSMWTGKWNPSPLFSPLFNLCIAVHSS